MNCKYAIPYDEYEGQYIIVPDRSLYYDTIECNWQSDEIIAKELMNYNKRSHKRIVHGKEYDVGAWYDEYGNYVFDCHSPFYCADNNLEFRPTYNWEHTKIVLEKFRKRVALRLKTSSIGVRFISSETNSEYLDSNDFIVSSNIANKVFYGYRKELCYCNMIYNLWDVELELRTPKYEENISDDD
jgi:hypothetical protein